MSVNQSGTCKPNVLFICVDQMRADALGCLGNTTIHTPNLDNLAADGVAFSQYYSVSSPCCPARTSLLTGLYPASHGSITKDHSLKAEDNLASLLAEQQMSPVLFGFTDTVIEPYLHDKEGIMPGFSVDTYMNLHSTGLSAWMNDLSHKGYNVPANPLDIYRGPVTPYSAKDSDSAFLTERVLAYISKKHHKPWFAHVVYFRPHPPFIAPPPYSQMYQDYTVKLDNPQLNRFLNAHPMHQQMFDKSYPKALTKPLMMGMNKRKNKQVSAALSAKIEADTRTYYGLISELDKQVGRVIEQLKAQGDYDDTLIVFSSDHGEMLGDNWLYNKGAHFDASYHVPLVIKPHQGFYSHNQSNQINSAITGRVCQQFIESIDFTPTLLDMLQIDIPKQIQGRSFKPLFELLTQGNVEDSAEAYVHRTEVTYEYYYHSEKLNRPAKMLAVKDKQYKYVYYEDMPDLLFDLKSDPQQRHNVIDNVVFKDVIERYQQFFTER
jgi:arylsulfatase A-like enzyme